MKRNEAQLQPAATVEELAALQGELENWRKKCKVLQQSEVTYLEEIEALKAQKANEERDKAMASMLNKKPVVAANDNKIVNDKPKVVTEPTKVVNVPPKEDINKIVTDPAKIVKDPVKIITEASANNKPTPTTNLIDSQ